VKRKSNRLNDIMISMLISIKKKSSDYKIAIFY